jgi:hypothetical protein
VGQREPFAEPRPGVRRHDYPPNPETAGPSCPAVLCSLVHVRSRESKKGAILSHFSCGARRLSGRPARSASRFAAVVSDIDG